MFDTIVGAAIKPLTTPLGWQAFAYGVLGRVIVVYANEILSTVSDRADTAGDETRTILRRDDSEK